MIEGLGLGGVLAVSFVLAFVVILSAWRQRGAGVKASLEMPNATFDYQQSWLTTFAALLAILGALNFSSLVFNGDISLATLSLFFAMLVAASPLVYKAMGTLGGYIVASVATLWAAFGVVWSLGLVLNQALVVIEGQTEVATILMVGATLLIIPFIAVYAHKKMSSTLKSPKTVTAGAAFL